MRIIEAREFSVLPELEQAKEQPFPLSLADQLRASVCITEPE